MKKLKVAFVVGGFPSERDPSRGIFNLRTARALNEIVDVKVIHIQGWRPGRAIFKKEQIDGISTFRVNALKLPPLTKKLQQVNEWLANKISWFLLKKELNDIDIIHSVFITYTGPIGSYWKSKIGKTKVKHFSQAIGSDVNSQMKEAYSTTTMPTWFQDIDGLLCNSKALENTLTKSFHYTKAIQTAYRGIDVNQFKELMDARPKDDTTFEVLYLGGFGSYTHLKYKQNTKGGITLMESWKKLDNELNLSGVVLKLGGPDSQTEFVNNWIKSLKQPECVQVVGYVKPNEVLPIISKVDVVVIPSMEEGLPNLALEASLLAKPTIGTRVGGIPEVIIDKENGFLVPPGDAESLKETLLETMKHPELKAIGLKAKERILTDFNAATYAPIIVKFYQNNI